MWSPAEGRSQERILRSGQVHPAPTGLCESHDFPLQTIPLELYCHPLLPRSEAVRCHHFREFFEAKTPSWKPKDREGSSMSRPNDSGGCATWVDGGNDRSPAAAESCEVDDGRDGLVEERCNG
ncbi:hypothetical protein CC85DRAFT_1605 [Cutaneotrichosporon oleaginosum]|uniref:Uncharacterized protein n=1 Tax=Cutaneotrichosporon oleaginosum TaxID=879819 RepID=A0A0J0XZE0_9TREE|nr:uncharacterized protein CC85DRAFT_1605 [Cutaneotrichosporon oleaginosum]KLT46403.1 hypothetical protein CC85DRAFT_1605 [Cutaneotrichosporon oleaginosum]TXT15227.1 hypothetical protein COLE_01420 [Cutaneotrichosporon oleaginosum]